MIRPALILSALLAAAVQSPFGQTSSGTGTSIRIDGSNGVLPLATALGTAFNAQGEAFEVSLGTGLGGKARIDALESGAIDIALASHGLDLADLGRRGMTAHRIAVTPVVFAVADQLAVRAVSAAELCEILSGKTTSWKSVGGPELKIRPFLRPESEVDTEVVRASLPCMNALSLGPDVAMAQTTQDMIGAIKTTPGSIGLTTATAVRQTKGALRAISIDSVSPTPENVTSGKYGLLRPAYFVTRGQPHRGVVRFLEFVRSGKGDAVILENGALAAR
jgi:phosphate transport system substrate-binding protein